MSKTSQSLIAIPLGGLGEFGMNMMALRLGDDIIVLDATALNVAPLNHVPGAVVSLMDRTNVETVIVAGKVRKWKGQLLDVNLDKLRSQLEASRDFIFNAAGIPQDLFAPF